MASTKDKAGPADRRRDRARRRHLARRRQDRQLGQAHRRQIRHPRHHPLSDRRPEDPHRRHDRFPAARSPARRRCRERFAELAAEEAIAQSGIGTRGDFPGPLFLAVPPIEIEWPQRLEVGARLRRQRHGHLCRPVARRAAQFPAYHGRFLFGSVADHLADKFGTKGSPISLSTACASGATAIQLGVEAIRRGETDAALCIGTDGSINPEALIRFSLLSALSTSNDNPQKAAQAVLQEPRRLRHGRRRRRAGAGKLRRRQGARRQNPRRARRLRRDGRRLPPHPLEPGRQADHRLHRATRSRMPASRPTTSTTSTRTAPARRKTTRWKHLGVLDRVRRAHEERADLVEQIDDRPHAVGRRRGRGGVLAADAAAPAHSADHQLRRARSGDPARRRAEQGARRQACATRSPIPSASAARTSRW